MQLIFFVYNFFTKIYFLVGSNQKRVEIPYETVNILSFPTKLTGHILIRQDLELMISNEHKHFIDSLGEKPGLVVRAEDSSLRGRGFKSRRILDGCKQFASYYIKEN
jgi:hypothetical protein